MSKKNQYLIKALRAYRSTVYGQFDQETHYTVEETQDAAAAIEGLEDAMYLTARKLEAIRNHAIDLKVDVGLMEKIDDLYSFLLQETA